MFIDGRQIAEGTILETDLAIIGAGAAGITLARQLSGKDMSIALIESGGFDFDAEVQDLYDGETIGVPYTIDTSRLRYFGGSTNHWGGWCRPLEAIDFEARDWVPHSGWPITRAELDPFYDRATKVCQLGSTEFDNAQAWSNDGKNRMMAFPGGDIMTRFFLYSPPTRFGQKYRNDIGTAPNIKTYLNANVTEIVPDATGQTVEKLSVATLTGRRFEIRPKYCILATGGIENARMLLLSHSIVKKGLGNAHDIVGRYFMEHPHVDAPAQMVFTDISDMAAWYPARVAYGDTHVRGVFMHSADYLRREKRLGTIMTIHRSRPITALDPLLANGERPLEPSLLHLTRSTTSHAAPDENLGVLFGTGCATEQAPNPQSRVTLSTDKDALGLPRTRMDWRLTAEDRENLRRNFEALARAFGRWGEGRVRILFPHKDKWEEAEGWGNHHMGTTRMSADPHHGVVNADCKVHGMNNLYIAGSSVFTTSGTINPTLTIVALALRLADHVEARMTRGA
ncbi:MAG: GMC family oxidoreductase [Parvibaculum sp.]